MKSGSVGLAIFRALGDKTRYNIVLALLRQERCACELPALVSRAQPTVSLQLKFLAKCKILKARRDGRKILYSLHDERIRRLVGMAEGKGR